MKKLLLALALTLVGSEAFAVSSYLGTAVQDVSGSTVNIGGSLPAGTNNIGDVDVLTLPSIPTGTNNIGTVSGSTVTIGSPLPAGTNNIGDVDVLTLPSIPTGTNNIGTVSGSTVTIGSPLPTGTNTIGEVKVTDGTDDLAINADGSINAVVTSANVSASTVGVRGASGGTITDTSVGSGLALDVLDASRANLDGKALVYKSSDNFVVGGALTLTGIANQVDLQAFTNDCTFNLAGGESINVAKNTSESFNFDYTSINLTVNLTAKSAGATCKARITGAN